MPEPLPPTRVHYSPGTAAVVVAALIGLLAVVLAIALADRLASDDPPPAPAALARPGQPDPDAPANEMEPEMRRDHAGGDAPGNL
jgi:hypothetical protein